MDTGATHHFFTKSSTPVLSNINLVADGIRVLLPNNAVIESTHKAHINIPTLPPAATETHLFSSLASGNLLSIGQLCDNGCTAHFTKDTATISFRDQPILRGTRNSQTKLWHLTNQSTTFTPTSVPSINATIGQPSTAARIRFYHAALFSPTLSTLTQAIKSGFLATFPGLDIKSVSQHPPVSEATIKGHMNAKRSNQRSTQRQFTTPHHIYNAVKFNPTKTNQIYASCFEATGKIATDQTGPFLVSSTSGNRYVFVLYDYDSNYIAVQAIPSRTKLQILRAYRQLLHKFKRRGLHPRLQRLDNEVSHMMMEEMDSNNISYQLTPAGNHGRNAAKRAIQTFKNHFVAGLCSVHSRFTLH